MTLAPETTTVSDDLTAALSACTATLPAALSGIRRYQGDLAEVASRATALRERVLALADSLPAPLPGGGPLAEALGLSAAARSADGANALLCRHAEALALVAALAGTLSGAVERAGMELEAAVPAHALLPAAKTSPLCDHCDCYHPPTEPCEPGAPAFEEAGAANAPAMPPVPPALVSVGDPLLEIARHTPEGKDEIGPGAGFRGGEEYASDDEARAAARAELEEEWQGDDSAGCGDDGGVLGEDSPLSKDSSLFDRRSSLLPAQQTVLAARPDAVLRECPQGAGQVMYRVAVPLDDGTRRWVGARRRTPESAWRSAADRLGKA